MLDDPLAERDEHHEQEDARQRDEQDEPDALVVSRRVERGTPRTGRLEVAGAELGRGAVGEVSTLRAARNYLVTGPASGSGTNRTARAGPEPVRACRPAYPPADPTLEVSDGRIESPSRSAEELRDMTRQWLARAAAGRVDGGDRRRRRRRASPRSAAGSTTPSGASSSARPGYATPTWPAEYGAGLSLSPGEARFVNEVLEPLQGAAARTTSSASAWVARRSWRGAPRR